MPNPVGWASRVVLRSFGKLPTMTTRAMSIVGGRPHLIKAESVHAALHGTDVQHEIIRVALSKLSDYPADDDFALPPPTQTIVCDSQAEMVPRLIAAVHRSEGYTFLVYGDLATSDAAVSALRQANRPFVHIEAGYRSGDLSDHEEATRLHADRHANSHIVYSSTMRQSVLGEGISSSAIFLTPDPARLTLARWLSERSPVSAVAPLDHAEARPGLVTFHHDESFRRPRLGRLVAGLEELAARHPLHLVLYERTREELRRAQLLAKLLALPGLAVSDTLKYGQYVRTLVEAPFVVTDSSGVQDDCMVLGKPCVVIRRASPRPEVGTRVLLRTVDCAEWGLADAVDKITRTVTASATSSRNGDGGAEDAATQLRALGDGLRSALDHARCKRTDETPSGVSEATHARETTIPRSCA